MKQIQKLYPFSLRKHAHDIELARNYVRNRDNVKEFEEITALYTRMMESDRNGICFICGADIARAKEIVAWATMFRMDAQYYPSSAPARPVPPAREERDYDREAEEAQALCMMENGWNYDDPMNAFVGYYGP